jgi:hypothetical protein
MRENAHTEWVFRVGSFRRKTPVSGWFLGMALALLKDLPENAFDSPVDRIKVRGTVNPTTHT